MWLRAQIFFVIFLQSLCAWALSPDAHRLCAVDAFRQLGYSDAVVEILVQANRSVDATKEFGNPPSHFDNERFEDGSALLRRRIGRAAAKLVAGDVNGARIELGKATHAVQDFFSHSNYVEVMEGQPIDLLHLKNPPAGIGCYAASQKAILVTGYYPDERVPKGKCSHTQLHKDDMERPLFYKALHYAKIHTAKLEYEFERLIIAREPARAQQLLAKFKDASHL